MINAPYYDDKLGILFTEQNVGGDLLHQIHFANGSGISIITGKYAYCTPYVTYEVMMLGKTPRGMLFDFEHDSVLGYLPASEVRAMITALETQQMIDSLIVNEGIGL